MFRRTLIGWNRENDRLDASSLPFPRNSFRITYDPVPKDRRKCEFCLRSIPQILIEEEHHHLDRKIPFGSSRYGQRSRLLGHAPHTLTLANQDLSVTRAAEVGKLLFQSMMECRVRLDARFCGLETPAMLAATIAGLDEIVSPISKDPLDIVGSVSVSFLEHE